MRIFQRTHRVVVCRSVLFALIAFCCCLSQAQAQWTTNGNDISNSNSGNVGVKTTAPEFPLQVNNASPNILGVVYTGTLSGTSGSGIQALTSTTSSAADQRLGFFTFGTRSSNTSHNAVAIEGFSSQAWTLGSAQGGYLTFATTANGTATRTERMRISHNGNVGIGTTNPADAFHVYNTANSVGTIRLQGGNNYAAFLGVWDAGQMFILSNNRHPGTGGNYNTSVVGAQLAIGAPSAPGDIAFYTVSSGSTGNGTELARIKANGRFGIGTNNPGHQLDVQGGSINASAGLCIAGICKSDWSQIGGGAQWATSGSAISYSAGNVGIGVTDPTQKLEVNGSALINTIYGSNATGGVLSLQSTSHATKGTIQIGVDQTTTTNIGQSGTPGNKLIVATDRLIVNNAGVRVNGATDYSDFSVTKVNITNPDALQFRSTSPNIQSNGSLLFTVQNVGGDNVKFSVQNNSISNAFVIDSTSATPAKLLDVRNLGASKFTVDGNGNVTSAGNISAKYQDLAEWVPASQQLAAGTVVVLDKSKSNHVVSSSKSYDPRVAGVISAQPGIMLGERGDDKVLVATTGRVLVNVDATNGPIEVGDLLVTSDREGVAMKSQPVEIGGVQIHRPGTLIGKALEPLASGTGKILVLLSLQ